MKTNFSEIKFKEFLTKKGIKEVIDFDKKIRKKYKKLNKPKTPDLELPEYNLLVEIKSLELDKGRRKKIREKGLKIWQQAINGQEKAEEVGSYEAQIANDIQKALDKFKEWTDKSSLIVIFDIIEDISKATEFIDELDICDLIDKHPCLYTDEIGGIGRYSQSSGQLFILINTKARMERKIPDNFLKDVSAQIRKK